MIRVTPLRLITLQCSQIGLTLVLTFTDGLPYVPEMENGQKIGQDE